MILEFYKKNYFLIYLVSFILLMSFFIGISIGLKRAKARNHFAQIFHGGAISNDLSEKISLPKDALIFPVGKDTTINGKEAEIANFFTDQKVPDLIFTEMNDWKKRGFEVFSAVTERRAYAIAFNFETKERYSIRAWMLPEKLKNSSFADKTTQGMIVYSKLYQEIASDSIIADVPLMSRGKAGTIFASEEPFGKSYTAIYTNPANIEENIAFYKEELIKNGWSIDPSISSGAISNNIANLVFHKNKEEITLLFSSLSRNQTVVNIVRLFFKSDEN